jgi:hypothetical protein
MDLDAKYEAQIDGIVGLVNARQPLPPDEARAFLFQALDAVRWYRWARVTFVVPDHVADGELRQWLGERLTNGDRSIIRDDRMGFLARIVAWLRPRPRQTQLSIPHFLVIVTDGPHAGRTGKLVSVRPHAPEPFVVEFQTGGLVGVPSVRSVL